jgi:bifunctional non-homologous end joining protein LigD
LLVGTPLADGRLQFGGGVGTGFNTATLESLTATMRALSVARSPFAGVVPRDYVRTATWIRPELRAEIEIAEWTNDGLVRHASFLGLV